MSQNPISSPALAITPGQARLYTFVDTAYLNGRSAGSVAAQLAEGGSDIIQLRAKGMEVGTVAKLALEVQKALAGSGVALVLNDHAALTAELGIPMCHLGQEDFFDAGYRTVRDVFPKEPHPQLGLSSHAPEQALRAIAAGACYLGVGPVYPTGTKPGRAAVTLEYVRWCAQNVSIPWFAIGGIHAGNLDAVLDAGARRVCVVSAILQAADIAKACQELKARLISEPLETN